MDGETLEELVTFTLDGDELIPTMIAGIEIAAEEDEMEDEGEEMEMEDEEAAGPVMGGMAERIVGMA